MYLRRSSPGLLLSLLLIVSPIGAQEDPVRLEGLVVTGSPTPRPFDAVATHVTVLDGDELRARGISRVQDALRELPGVDVVENGSFGAVTSVFMRGGESDYVLVLVDGVQVNDPGGSFDFSSLDLAAVERIEVVRGPASALYGSDAVAGVIHVISRAGSTGSRGFAHVRGGSYGRRDASFGLSGASERAGYALTLSRSATDGILGLNNAHRISVLTGNVHFRPDERTRGGLTLRLSDRKYRYPTDGSGRVEDRNAFTFEERSVVGVSLSRRLTDRLDLQAFVGLNETDGGSDDQPDGVADTLGFFGFTSLDHVRRTSVDLRAGIRVAGALLTVGGELEEERQRSFTESMSEYGSSTGRGEHTRWNRGAYLHALGAVGRLSLEAGTRLEDNERFGRLGTWEMGAVLRLGEGGTRVRGKVGRGIKEPTFLETFASGFALGNPELDPERSESWEVGLEQRLARGRGFVAVTLFDQAFEDLIQYTAAPPSEGGPNFFNVARAGARGAELVGEARAGAWTIGGSWTWLDTEVLDAGFDSGAGATFVSGGRLLRRPEHSGSVRLGYAREPLMLSFEVQHVGEREDRDWTAFPTKPVLLRAHTLVSVGMEVRARDDFTVVVRGENLTGRSYEEVFGFRAPGRGLYVGGRLTFGDLP